MNYSNYSIVDYQFDELERKDWWKRMNRLGDYLTIILSVALIWWVCSFFFGINEEGTKNEDTIQSNYIYINGSDVVNPDAVVGVSGDRTRND